MARGGYRPNAGRPGGKIKIEACRRIDARQMQRMGMFAVAWKGTWWWKDSLSGRLNASIDVLALTDSMQLGYRCNDALVQESIGLARVDCGFGGHRVMFHCPNCQSRCVVLLFFRGRFRCRTCHNLAYQSQSESELGRILLAQVKPEKRLHGGHRRPKGMHQTTYRVLRAKLNALKKKQWDIIDGYYLQGK